MTNTVNPAPTPRPYYGICVNKECSGYARGHVLMENCPHCGQRLARVVRTEREA